MKPIEKDELFGHFSQFLESKGIELKKGSYAQAIQRSCGILADVVNLGQQGLDRAKEQIDKNVELLRQTIHERTAPKTKTAPPPIIKTAAPKASARKSTKSSGGRKKTGRSSKH